jgi:hypothetical protein
MNMINFPDWMPFWAQLLIMIGGLLLLLAFAAMPFSVFGVKARLEAIEERLDEIQGEIRALTLRLPEPGLSPTEIEPALMRARAAAPPPVVERPPIPPAPPPSPLRPEALRPTPTPGRRSEPRLR